MKVMDGFKLSLGVLLFKLFVASIFVIGFIVMLFVLR